MSNSILRVASFNLYNLVLPNRRYYGDRTYTTLEFQKKKDWINGQLNEMRADVIGLQEVFHEEALREILKDNPNYSDAEVLVADPKGDGPVVGLISKFPIAEYEIIREFPERIEVEGMEVPFTHFSRPLLRAKVEIQPGVYIDFFVAHLKSKRPMIPDGVDRYDPREKSKGYARALLLRAAEANALRHVLLDTLEHRTDPVVALGDFNDTHTSVTTQIISGQAPWRQLPFEVKKKYWDVLLYHAKDIQARQSYRDVYYTHIHNGHYESLDHIMVSEELVENNPNRIGKVGFVKVFNDHLIDQTLSDERVAAWKSDHAQVVASIELGK